MGSPFEKDHFWNRVGLEVAGGYAPVVSKGAGYLSKGFNVTAGVIDHLSPRWAAMAEVNIFGLRGNAADTSSPGNPVFSNSNTVVAVGVAGSYRLLSRRATSPYIIGGAGYYNVGSLSSSGSGISDPTAIVSANAAGFNGGAGICHRLYDDRSMEIFAEGRYHYIASGSTAFGQISLFPIAGGVRW